MMKRGLACLLLLVATQTSAYGDDAGPCSLAFYKLVQSAEPVSLARAEYPLEWEGQIPPYIDRERIVPALKQIFRRISAQGAHRPPPMRLEYPLADNLADERELISTKILRSLEARIPGSQNESGILLPGTSVEEGGGSPVIRYSRADGKQIFFRPFTDPELVSCNVPRFTFAASLLNRRMGLNTVPGARFGRIEGKLGVISEEATGLAPKTLATEDPNVFKNPVARADAEAFEFLVGNPDARAGNLHLDDSGNIQVFDHGRAWSPWLPNSTPWTWHRPPLKYSRRFIEALRGLDRQTLQREFSDYLTELEIEGLLFRRQILLEDRELRGASALLD